MIPYIYIALLSLMLFVLYLCGKSLRKDYRIFSVAGVVSMLVYTLNEGLRFGRGIDYNHYWGLYEDVSKGSDIEKDYFFTLFSKMLIMFGCPYQIEVAVMSFMFILATLILLKSYKDIIPLALPLFVFLSMHQVENMVRWYLGYSFFLIGLSLLLKEGGGKISLYVIFSIIAFTIHFGLALIPFIFYMVYLRKTPLFHPIVTIIAFLAVYFLFEASFMLNFIDYINLFSYLSDNTSNYIDNAEYWLTSGFAGMGAISTTISLSQFAVFLLIVIGGYECIKKDPNKNQVFAYNIFTIGLLLYPISKHVELFVRYRSVFLFFEAIVLSYIIYYYLIRRIIIVHQMTIIIATLIFVYHYSESFTKPLISPAFKYMYVWDKANQTSDLMIQKYKDDMYKARLRAKHKH